MAYNKLTPTELEKWSNFWLDYVKAVHSLPAFQNLSASEQEKDRKLTAIIYSQAKLGNVSIILSFTENLLAQVKLLPDNERQKKWVEADNLTTEEYLNNIKKRIREHCVARGHYDPNNRIPLATFNQKLKDKPKNEDKNKLDNLMSQMNSEDIDFVWKFLNFVTLMSEINPDIISQQSKDLSEEEYQSEFGIILEDLVKTIEVAEEKLKNKNKSKNPTSGSPSSQNNLTAEEIEKIVKRLLAKKNKLNEEKGKIENQSQNNDQEKKLRDNLLNQNDKEKKEIDKEIDRLLKKTNSQNKENNNNDNKWAKIAIGLGIAALVIGLICLIVLLANRGEKKK